MVAPGEQREGQEPLTTSLPEVSQRTRGSSTLVTLSRGLGAVIGVCGVIVLIGWTFDLPLLTRGHVRLPAMKANAALGFLLLGLALVLPTRLLLAKRALATVVAALGAVTLIEYAGLDLGIDQLIARERDRTELPGRMAMTTAFGLMTAGVGFLLSTWVRAGARPATEAAALITLVLGFVPALGHLYGVAALYAAGPANMAPSSALAFVAASIALLGLVPGGVLPTLVRSEGSGGIAARRLLPVAVVIPILFGWIYGVELGIGFYAAANVLVLGGLILWMRARLDETDRGRLTVERALAAREALSSEAPVGIFETDPKGLCTFVNHRWCRLAGLALSDAQGTGWTTALHPQDRARVSDDFQASIAEGREFATECRFLHPDGTIVWVSATAVERRDEDGRTTGFLGTVTDITARRATEASLARSEQSFRTLIASAPIGVLVHHQGIIVFVNHEFERLLGHEVGPALVGRPMLDSVHPDDRAGVEARLRNVQGGVWLQQPNEVRCLRADGRVVHVEATAVPSFFDGRAAIMVIVRDVTDRLRAEDERQKNAESLQRSLHEKEVLLREVHHRVKNNLQVISSLLNLQMRQVADSAARSALAESRDRVHSIALVHQKLYQAEGFAEIDFTDYLTGLLENLVHAQARGARPEVRVSGEQVRLPLDLAVPCALVVNELVINALKYAFPDGRSGTIAVTLAREAGGTVRLEIADDGVGLPDEATVGGTRSLGLNLVAMLCDQIDGVIAVDRSAGTRFTLRFVAPAGVPAVAERVAGA